MQKHDIVVIGGGPAGMAAAVAAYDAGCKDVAILERESQLGGILQQCIHNGFGLHKFGMELTGPEYATAYMKQVAQRNITVYTDATVISVTRERVVTAQSPDGIIKIQANAVILAMGCRERSRGALNICGTRPAGIYSAGTAQKLINCMGYQVGKRVVILGSGDIGLIMARRMCLEGAKVEAVCEVMPYSGGLNRNIVQCLEDFEIPLYLSTTVCQIHGEKRLEGVTIAQVDQQRNVLEETKKYIPCDTLLLSVGLIPENELTRAAGVPIDTATNGALVDEYCQTQVPGIFACGNVLHVHDLVDYVSDEAERAGLGAVRYITGQLSSEDYIQTEAGEGVRYVLPQSVRTSTEKISLYFRVTKPYKNVKILVRSQNRIVCIRKRQKAAPGEMEKIEIGQNELRDIVGPIVVSVEALA